MIKNLTAQAAKYPTIESLAAAIGSDVKSAPAVNFDAYQFGVAGNEPAVVGKIIGIACKQNFGTYQRNAGVYVVLPTNAQVNPAPFDI